jgi:hypothetical protein
MKTIKTNSAPKKLESARFAARGGIATSLILACVNLTARGLVHMNLHSDAAIVIEMVFLPLILLATLVFLIGDFIRPVTRPYALLALLLSVPGALLVSSLSLRGRRTDGSRGAERYRARERACVERAE